MKFLFMNYNHSMSSFTHILESMGHTVDSYNDTDFQPIVDAIDPSVMGIHHALQDGDYDYVFSYPFIPVISNICMQHGVIYISWIFDSPLLGLFHPSIQNPTNRIFIFDYIEYEYVKKSGAPHIYYMPMAAETDYINDFLVTPEDETRYGCEISFVGTLYENNLYNDCRHSMPEVMLTHVNQYLMSHLCQWDGKRRWPILPAEYVEPFMNTGIFDLIPKHYNLDMGLYLGMELYNHKLSEMERVICLNALAERHEVHLYSGSRSENLVNVVTRPHVNYYTELGKIYHCSKINLNFTKPNIETGVPQRIFDIMAYGGFMMTNYQSEMDSLFEVGKELVVFHDLEELKSLCDYYLTHEEERQEIALQGYLKVNEVHTYHQRVKQIIEICEQTRERSNK